MEIEWEKLLKSVKVNIFSTRKSEPNIKKAKIVELSMYWS